MGYNMSSDIALGQLGSGYLDDAGALTPPTGKVIVAITCIQDTSFTLLTQELPTNATFKGPINATTGYAETNSFGTTANIAASNGVNSDAVGTSDVFPKGITIYGRWKAVTLNTGTTATSQVIVYYGY